LDGKKCEGLSAGGAGAFNWWAGEYDYLQSQIDRCECESDAEFFSSL